ncbi:MAG: glycine zipper 2TM domain-containing protein [Burkholderiales bacterium]|nr:glycine zipper 2TM domain-containing protein [Burkholderiales bacterium]
MKRTILFAAAAAASFAAAAQPGPSFVDRARVSAVEPQYETVQLPREECGSQWVTEQRAVPSNNPSYGGMAIGAIAGGILGNQVGKGSGKDAATAAGVVAGAMVGNQLGRNNSPDTQVQSEQREVRTCRTVYDTQQRVTGYRVTYEYQGNQYTTVMPQQPGRTLNVRVTVTPEPEYHRR